MMRALAATRGGYYSEHFTKVLKSANCFCQDADGHREESDGHEADQDGDSDDEETAMGDEEECEE